jgi:uncharacterized protein (DUF885 family)
VQRERLIAAIQRDVLPALAQWLEMLEAYALHARPGEGICHLPDGEALYRHHIESWTTLVSRTWSVTSTWRMSTVPGGRSARSKKSRTIIIAITTPAAAAARRRTWIPRDVVAGEMRDKAQKENR